ncbi:hypothetical protein SAY86_018530 [Trapa natans]|uniref:Uncharacterized protein n=1 Tax=Trapa natans TaxID=22666 RepID=A0AAN7LR27_TRANT|nr:hypothetical protein SAY86_018530 [Trapa natans]
MGSRLGFRKPTVKIRQPIGSMGSRLGFRKPTVRDEHQRISIRLNAGVISARKHEIMAVVGAALVPPSMAGNGRGDKVYVAAVELRATRGPGQSLLSAAYSLNLWDLQHFMVIIKPAYSDHHPQVHVFDFQPMNPDNIYVALAALSGRSVAGYVQRRKLTRLPKERCWHVGTSESDSLQAASEFNKNWRTDLRIGSHDCRHYTNGNGLSGM